LETDSKTNFCLSVSGTLIHSRSFKKPASPLVKFEPVRVVNFQPAPTQDRALNSTLSVVHCVQKYENIQDTLLDLDKRYQYVIVDEAGRDSRELRTGMTAANTLIVPLRPSQPDLDTLATMQEIITQVRNLNPGLTVYGLLTMAPTNPAIQEETQARDFLADYLGIRLLSVIIRDRKIYRDCMSEGMGVVEMNNEKARDEVMALVDEVL
jgi:chromosome partitioning protein